jgi:hypothetical protein
MHARRRSIPCVLGVCAWVRCSAKRGCSGLSAATAKRQMAARDSRPARLRPRRTRAGHTAAPALETADCRVDPCWPAPACAPPPLQPPRQPRQPLQVAVLSPNLDKISPRRPQQPQVRASLQQRQRGRAGSSQRGRRTATLRLGPRCERQAGPRRGARRIGSCWSGCARLSGPLTSCQLRAPAWARLHPGPMQPGPAPGAGPAALAAWGPGPPWATCPRCPAAHPPAPACPSLPGPASRPLGARFPAGGAAGGGGDSRPRSKARAFCARHVPQQSHPPSLHTPALPARAQL